MTQQNTYDLIVIGAGAAGSGAALSAAEQGKRVALVEKDHIGGSCTNYGCDPSKRLLHTANLLAEARTFEQFGLRGGDDVSAEWPLIQRRLTDLVSEMRGGDSVAESARFYEEKGIDVYAGSAAFRTPHALTVGDRTLTGDHILIAAGSKPLVPPIDGIDEVSYLTNREALYLPHLPASLLVIGGGPVGVELAQLFARFGTTVTLVEAADHLLPHDDPELAQLLAERLSEEGVTVHVRASLNAVRSANGGIDATLRYESGYEGWVSAEKLLLAVGRAPDLDQLNLDAAGVTVDGNGWIEVDDTLRTSVPHIWAAGDVTGGYQFTHVAAPQGTLAARNAFADSVQPFNDRAVPWVTYTDPALAHVGRTAPQLDAEGVPHDVLRKPLAETSRAKIEQRPAGMIKLLVGKDGQLLGGTILGARAGDMIAPLCLALRHNLPVTALADTILPYPTWAAELSEAAAQWRRDT